MSDVFSHFGINEEQKNFLISKKITEVDLINNLNLFDPHGSNCEITKLGIMYYMDERGDFQGDELTKPGLIANAIFESLEALDKVDIFNYLEILDEET